MLQMRILFRVDASLIIGTGHVMRCLTLAKALVANRAHCYFACREHPGNLIDFIRQQGFEVVALPIPKDQRPSEAEAEVSALAHSAWLGCDWATDAAQTKVGTGGTANDWLVVDHYALDASWESAMRNVAKKIMVIDDIADRHHDCDVLLDQNYYSGMPTRYAGKVPEHCQLMLGPRYALLREDFRKLREQIKPRTGEVRRILVFFGGVDPDNYTGLAIKALARLDIEGIAVDVVIGAQHPARDEIRQMCAANGYNIHIQTSRMAALMAEADLGVGAGGSAIWERCCLGLPTLCICIAENQRIQLIDAAEAGLLYSPSSKGSVIELLCQHLKSLFENAPLLKQISRSQMKVVDGLGAERVVEQMKFSWSGFDQATITVRRAKAADAAFVWHWRNSESTRQHFFDPSPVPLDAHIRWWEKSLSDPTRILLIGCHDKSAFGVIRFDFDTTESAVISIYIDPDMTGRRLGRGFLFAGLNWLRRNHPEVVMVLAEVIPENTASMSLFSGAGFSERSKVLALKC